jgi:predicted dehydrogenase
VIGAGYWGKNLVRVCAELGVLAGICDASPATLEALRREYPGVLTSGEPSRLIEGPFDAIVIAAPAEQHCELALAALAAGKHVFVEKPLALTVADGESVAAAAERAERVVFVGHLLIYHPAVRRLRAAIAEGAIGPVWHVRSRRLSFGKLRATESVWWSFAPHDLALAVAIFGSAPLQASAAQAGRLRPEVWDAAYGDFVFPENRSAHIEVSWLDPNKSQRLDVFGANGVLTFEDSRDGAKLVLTPCGAREEASGSHELWRMPPRDLSFEAGEPLRAEMEAFLAAAESGTPPETDARHGVDVLRALTMADAAALRSAQCPRELV